MAGIGIPVKKIKRNSGSMMRNYWEEATREKENLDPDIDLTKTHKNVWIMGSPEMDFPGIVKAYADSQKDARGRSIRSDAVVCMNAVIKPEAEYIDSLPEDEQMRLLDIAVDNFIELQGRERFKEGRCAIVYHFDEPGGHAHIFWLPVVYDKELQREKLSAKECCNVKWLNKVNRTLPGKVREAGFDIRDADCWDADMTPEEKAALLERRKKKKNGRSSAQYKADKEKEIEQLEQKLEAMRETVESVKVYEKPSEALKAFRELDINKTLTGQIKLSQNEFNMLSEALEASMSVAQENAVLHNQLQELQGIERDFTEAIRQRDFYAKKADELRKDVQNLAEYKRLYQAIVEYLGDQYDSFVRWYNNWIQDRQLKEKDLQR